MHSLIDVEDAFYSLIVKFEQKKALAAKQKAEDASREAERKD